MFCSQSPLNHSYSYYYLSHLDCDDTILMERILSRAGEGGNRTDDNVHTALKRLRTYHKYHNSTIEWLKEQHVPVINLDCSGDPESVWNQLVVIGRLMRPVTKISETEEKAVLTAKRTITAASIMNRHRSGATINDVLAQRKQQLQGQGEKEERQA
jgi:desulfoferrodoxin (superoxide reductase-like protein)